MQTTLRSPSHPLPSYKDEEDLDINIGKTIVVEEVFENE